MRMLPTLAATALAALAACGNGEEKIEPVGIDGNIVPTMTTRDVDTYISDSGITRYHITAEQWLMFDNADEPHWKFPDGMFMERYDDHMTQAATIVCDSAFYFTGKRLWRLDGNVRMRNVEGDRFLTEQLFWDQNRHKVYSDSFIHIERSDRTIEGYGFESNENMTAYTILRPSGIFPVSDFRGPGSGTDSIAADSAAGSRTGRRRNNK